MSPIPLAETTNNLTRIRKGIESPDTEPKVGRATALARIRKGIESSTPLTTTPKPYSLESAKELKVQNLPHEPNRASLLESAKELKVACFVKRRHVKSCQLESAKELKDIRPPTIDEWIQFMLESAKELKDIVWF